LSLPEPPRVLVASYIRTQKFVVTLSFNVAPGFSLGQAVERIRSIERNLKTPIMLQGSFQGTALTSTPILVAAAILVVYIVLGMLYESYIHPITILSSLPSAGVGALIMLMLFHYDLSVIALIVQRRLQFLNTLRS
jgi:HAE1 family hydrophobic/amphiphilic exporter-1